MNRYGQLDQSQEASMVIVAGTIELDPDQREAFLAGRIDGMRTSRAEPGCLEYTLSADPTDPSRVMLFERWARQEDLDAHLAALRARPAAPGTSITPKAASISVYDVTGERPLRR
jgi:quinol monooxygenase YgiN